MNRKIHKGLFYAMLLCVYAAFFSVESFYNFEGQPRGKEDNRYSVVKNTPLHSAAICRFRLNKRYHPEVIPPCPIVSPEGPRWCLIPVRLGSPGDRPLPAIAIIHYSLRGPPAAA
ncbi:MAG TPA: hypothetical protein VNV35_21195 [Puia sp.]|nr:hypothetical protein [Puia sp.]